VAAARRNAPPFSLRPRHSLDLPMIDGKGVTRPALWPTVAEHEPGGAHAGCLSRPAGPGFPAGKGDLMAWKSRMGAEP